eukprot:c11695_g1_i1 orf=75-560(+)
MAKEEEQPWQGNFEAVVEAPISRVWEVTSDFSGIHKWAPSVVSACTLLRGKNNEVGCLRRCDGADGGFLGTETLLTMEDASHRYSYRVEESRIPGLPGYISTFHLTPCFIQGHSSDDPLSYTHIAWSYQVPPIPSSSPQAFQTLIFDFYRLCISDLENFLL